jgi:hypothetical protein
MLSRFLFRVNIICFPDFSTPALHFCRCYQQFPCNFLVR